jgi:hypothetical protein
MIGSRGENAMEDETSQPWNTRKGKNAIGGNGESGGEKKFNG